MAMLAEPRRKQRIGPNPRGQLFIDDEQNVGRSMLRTMGWKEGDGLGATHQGISVPIKPKIQQDSRGLGFDIKSSPWVVHNDKFSELLADLNVEYCGNDSSEPELKEKVAEESTAGNELEKKSKSSRARIHYHKSVKNKDLSKISSKDWSCIFGKSVDVDEKVIPLNPTKFNSVENQAEQETEKYVHAGSMVDYFKAKMQEKLLKQSQLENQMKQEPDSDDIDVNVDRPRKKKKHKMSVVDSNNGVSKEDEVIQSNVTKSKSNINQVEQESQNFVSAGAVVNFETKIQEKLFKLSQPEIQIKQEPDLDNHLDVKSERPNKKKKHIFELDSTNDISKHEEIIPSNGNFNLNSIKLEQESGLDNVDMSCERPKKKKKRNLVSTIGVSINEKLISSNFKLHKIKIQDYDKFVNESEMADYFELKMQKKLLKQSKNENEIMQEFDLNFKRPEKKKKHKNSGFESSESTNTVSNIEQPAKKKKKKDKDVDLDVAQVNSTVEETHVKKKRKTKNLDTDFIHQDSSVEKPAEKKKHIFELDSTNGISKEEKIIPSNGNNLNNIEAEQESEKFVNAGSMVDYFKAKMQQKLLKQQDMQVKQEQNLENDYMSCERPKKKKKHIKFEFDSTNGISKDDEIIPSNGHFNVNNIKLEQESEKLVSNIEEPDKKKRKKHKDIDADVTQVNCIAEETHVKKKKKPKNLDTDFIHQDASFEKPAKKKKHKNRDTELIHEVSSLEEPTKKKKKQLLNTDVVNEDPSVLSKSPVSGDVESLEGQSWKNVTPKVKCVWDGTTVIEVAKNYRGANILDIPGYPITPGGYNLQNIPS